MARLPLPRTLLVSVLAIAGLVGGPTAIPQGHTTALARAAVPGPTVGCTYDRSFIEVEQTCINVYGDGLYVDRVTGELEKVAKSPSGVCGAEIHVFGRLADGSEYSQIGVARCGVSSAYVDFYPRTNFQNGSQLCTRGRVGATDFNDPACVTIKA